MGRGAIVTQAARRVLPALGGPGRGTPALGDNRRRFPMEEDAERGILVRGC